MNRSRGRRGAWWLAAAVVVALAVVLTFIAFRGSGDDDRLSVKAYGAAIRPHLLDGGRIAAEDMRPGLADLEFHRVTPERFREEAAAWRRGMERVRQALARLRPPHNLERAASLYDLALRQYEEAIDGFVVASREPPSELAAAITAAVPTAERADRTYDRADALVKAALGRG